MAKLSELRDATEAIDANRRLLRANVVKVRKAIKITEDIDSLQPELNQNIVEIIDHATSMRDAAQVILNNVRRYAAQHGVTP